MAVITVSRQLGSGGDAIAERVAQELGFQLVDRRLVEEIANITDTSVEEVEKYDEKIVAEQITDIIRDVLDEVSGA